MNEVHVVCDPEALNISGYLKEHRDEIAKVLNPLELVIYLEYRGILEEGEADVITDPDLPHDVGAEHVLTAVREHGNEGLKDFLWCLEQEEDWHIGHGYAAALLRGRTFTDETKREMEESMRLRQKFQKQVDVMRVIKDSVNVKDLIPSLRAHMLLTDDETEDLQLPHRSRKDQVTKLLRILATKGPLAELYFTHALADAVRENPAHRDILEQIYCQPYKDIVLLREHTEDSVEKDSSSRVLLGKRRKVNSLGRPYATKVPICTPRQVQAHGILLCDIYFEKINEIRRLHYLALWDEAEKVVQGCQDSISNMDAKRLGLPSDDDVSLTAKKELYVAVSLRNCSGYVTRKKTDKILEEVSKAKKYCKDIDNDNGRVLESKCEWMLAKMYRYAKQFDKAIEHIENAQLIHLRYNIAPGEDTTLCNYCKGCILASQLAQSGEYALNSKKFEEAKLCLRKATEHAAIRDYAIYQSHHMIRLAQLCLHSSQFVAGECRDKEQIEEAKAALNSHYIDENILAPRTKCLFYITRSDLHRNMDELELAERDAQRALNIAMENNFRTEIKSAKGRLGKINECKQKSGQLGGL